MKCPMMRCTGSADAHDARWRADAGDDADVSENVSTMGQMMGTGMMARDMMQMMTDMIKMQQKIIRGLSPVEKKEMMKDTDKMLRK